jgi:hypothetical protein
VREALKAPALGPAPKHRAARGAGLAAAAVLCLLGLGCGGDSGASGPASSRSATTTTGPGGATAASTSNDAAPPAATRRAARNLAKTFPPPKPSQAEGSAAAIKAGRRACRAKTPLEVKAEFYAAAEANLTPEQAKLVEELPAYEAEAAVDPNFLAGQLGALVYEMTLAAPSRDEGFQGCVYELAAQKQRELSGAR